MIALPGILGPNFRDHWIPTWVPLLGGRKAGVEPGGEGGGMLEVRGLQPGKQDGMSLFVGCVTIL